MSKRTLGLLAAALIAGLFTIGAAHADDTAAWTTLSQSGNVALMRHTDAPGGAGDPSGFRLDDCKTQRNLSSQGRADARAIGEKLKAEGVAIGRLLSSPWCRCVDTANLLQAGKVQVEATFSNVVVLSDQRDRLTEGARKLIGAWKGPGLLFIVTHGANIQALSGGTNPASGEIVVVASKGGVLHEIGRLPPTQR